MIAEDKGRKRGLSKAYSNAMMIRIRKDEQGEPQGEIVHLNLRKPAPYRGLAELEFRICGIVRLLNLPAGREESNNLLSGNIALPKEYCQIVPKAQWSRTDFCSRFPLSGTQETVCVEFLGNYHRSLQGRLRCRGTKERYVYFGSALELMYFFSDLLRETGQKTVT